MYFLIKKILLKLTINLSLFLILMIGIQNSSNKQKVNLIMSNTIRLPIGFIVGVSFISGSLSGSILSTNLKREPKLGNK